MLITISGTAGTGKSTVSKALESKLNYKRISIGDIKRKLAAEMGLNIIDFNKLGEEPGKAEEFDLKYEDYQRSLDPKENILLESRLGSYCQPDSFKILLTVTDEIAASRIMGDNRATDHFSSLEDAIEETKKRNETDRQRYMNLYNIDLADQKNYNLIIDTSNFTVEQTTNLIISKLEELKMINK